MMDGVISPGATVSDRIMIGFLPALFAVNFYRFGQDHGFTSIWAVFSSALTGCLVAFLVDQFGRWRRSRRPR